METLIILLELGQRLHPHLGADNHTNRLILTLFDHPEKLTKDEIFDLGKYYQRMIELIRPERRSKEVRAVLALKHKVYGIK